MYLCIYMHVCKKMIDRNRLIINGVSIFMDLDSIDLCL